MLTIVDPAGIASGQLPDFAVTRLVRRISALTGGRVRPVRVELRHDTACPMLAQHLGLPIAVNQPQNALVLDANSLTVPLVDPDARLLGILRRQSDEILARRPDKGDLAAGVGRWMINNLHTGELDTTKLARSLGMSPRSLRRRLAEQQLTPAGLITELRQQLAESYLAEGTYSLGQITYLLGYSDLSTFTRAVRRWTGTTPTRWRSELHEIASSSPPNARRPAAIR